jgi:Ca2+-binding EF-hand superfamily protein
LFFFVFFFTLINFIYLQAACPNGKISKADTVSFLRSINSGKEDQIEKQAADIHKAFDSNNDGIVDQREFLIGFALTSTGSVREKLKYVFRTYDHDKDGVINKKEIDRMVKVNNRINLDFILFVNILFNRLQ